MTENSSKKRGESVSLAEIKRKMIDLLNDLNDENFDERWGAMSGLVDKSEEVESEKTNFNVMLEEENDGVRILLRNDDGEEFNLNEFLPPNFSFEEGETYSIDNDSEKIIFPKDHVGSRGFLMSLLHEIGHTYAETPKPLSEKDDLVDFFKILGKNTFGDEEDGIGLLQAFRKMVRYPESKALEGPNVREFIKSERDSWAFALREMRNLERKGFDVFADFESVDDIEGYIFLVIINYELSGRVWSEESNQ